MKFSEYKNVKGDNKSSKNDLKSDKNKEKLIRNFLSSYEGKSQEDLIAEITKTAEKNRREGNLTDKDLDDFKVMLTPYLNAEQRKILNDVISGLKTK